MQLMPGPIAVVVYAALFCAVAGYLTMLVLFCMGKLEEAAPLTIFGLHTVGVFGLLLRYFGGSLKVTATSAQTGG